MSPIIIETTVSADRSVQVPVCRLNPGSRVRVTVTPLEVAEQYGVMIKPLPVIDQPLGFNGDPVTLQREWRSEWPG